MWQIGDIKFKSKVVLAPMAGYTSLGYREFYKPFGVGYSVTEMISDSGIVFHNQNTIDYLKTSKLDRPVAIQLFGSNIDTTLKAIDIINNELKIEYDFLDLNFGCPVSKVVNSHAGSYHLKDLDKLYDYVSKIVEHSKKPVTAKIRLGYDNNHINVIDTVDVLTKAGVKAIAIHARTKQEMYSGLPHYEYLKDLGLKMKIPLIISGNIFTLDDAIKAMDITKANAVMVARGGLGNPFLVKQIDTYFSKKIKLDSVDPLMNIKYCLSLADKLIEEKGEDKAMMIYRSIAPHFIKNIPGAKKYRMALSQNLLTRKDLEYVLNDISKEIGNYGK